MAKKQTSAAGYWEGRRDVAREYRERVSGGEPRIPVQVKLRNRVHDDEQYGRGWADGLNDVGERMKAGAMFAEAVSGVEAEAAKRAGRGATEDISSDTVEPAPAE